MLFFAFVSAAFAAATDLPELSTGGNVKWYVIKNTRSNKYAAYLSSNAKLEQVSDLSLAALFYFEGTVEETDQLHTATKLATVKIGNFAAGSNKLAGFDSWSADGATWYMWANNDANGIVVVDKTGDKNDDGTQKNLWGAWDDAGSSTKVGDYYAVSEGTNWVLEAKTFEDVKTIAKADLAKLAKLSALSTETNYNTAVSSVDAASTVEAVQSAVVTYLNTFNNKNVRFSNNGGDGRFGLNLSVNAGGSGLMGNMEAKDNSVWTMLSNGDGTFKLYNFSRNVYAKADRSCNADASQAGSFALKVTDDNKTALVAGNEMIHQATYLSPNFDILSWWDYNDNASIWTVNACDPTAITREKYDEALAAKATLPWGIQQAYGLVKNGDNIKVVVNHPSGGDCQPSSNLMDGLTSSYVHSSYDNGTMNTVETHYIQANLGEQVDQFYLYMTPRNANNRPKNITVAGSNTEDGEYTEICQITTTLGSSDTYMSEKLGTADTKYQYIRLYVTSTNTSSKFFTLSECYFLPASVTDVVTLVDAYHNITTASVLSNEIVTIANTLLNGEATLALANVKKEIEALLNANAGNVAEPDEAPALGQYPFENYQALDVISQSSSVSQATLEQAIVDFNKSKNVPVYFIASAHEGYAKGSAIYYDDTNKAWKWTATDANKYNRNMWMTIQNYTEENVPVVNEFTAEGVKYEICDYTTRNLMRDQKVQIVAVPEWEGVVSLQYANAGIQSGAQHAQSGGNLVNWGPAQKNDRQASAWRVEYIGTSYELDKLTDDQFTDLVALNTTYAASKNAALGEGLGYYSDATGNFATAQATAKTIIDMTLDKAVKEDAAAAKTALETAQTGLSLNVPQSGKFYRIKNDTGTGYLNAGTGTGRSQFAADVAEAASSVFYLDGNKLLSYTTGKYLAESGNFVHYTDAVGAAAGTTFAFSATPVAGKLSISFKNGNRSFYSNGVGGSNAASAGQTGEHYRFTVEEVTTLPVTITAAGYASFYAPVAVTLPAEVKAYTVSVNGEWATLNEIESGVIPANTGVVLGGADGEKASEGTYDLTVTESAEVISGNNLLGSVAASYVTDDAYVLGYVNVAEEGQPEQKEVGFYTATKNQQEGASWLNNGFKAYLPKPAQGVNALRFNFGGETTAIETVEAENANAPIYDLSGRRVLSTVKGGIYIQNGKKFIVK